jgi:hypothetical protein
VIPKGFRLRKVDRRRNEEARPAPARKRAAQHRQQRTVGWAELGSLHLAAQHVELVAQHHDLDILGMLASQASKQHADESARHKVEEGQGHRRIIPDPFLAAQRNRRVSEPHAQSA